MEQKMTTSDTIAAIATPPGRGAISMVRISGPDALHIAQKVWQGTPLPRVASHSAHLGFITDPEHDAEPIDQALATVFKAPNSFTGENMVEFGLHGSPIICRNVMSALINAGARPAKPGEFSQRAVAAGKMSLVSAEAAADLVAASSRAAQRIAMSQMRGGVENSLQQMQDSLLRLAALLELELDFSEEDVEFAPRTELLQLALDIERHLQKLHDSYRTGTAIKEGIPVAIVGPTNAGKSSLLNALTEEERAIVSDIHGTTRDIVEDTLTIEEYLFRLMDTAGLRDTADPIEQIGIANSHKALGKAHIVLLITDSTAPLPDTLIADTLNEMSEYATLIVLHNKVDIASDEKHIPGNYTQINLSTKTGQGLDTLKKCMVDTMREEQADGGEVLITNERHLQCIKEALTALKPVIQSLKQGSEDPTLSGKYAQLTPDLIAQSVREVITPLTELTGTALQTPALLQHIFSHFCIGK
ncbi:MAG: tRNA uridine-5-carboxymethylaminomethyl(34) synthesis GTPase MnmE [Prevotella sp.]|nr:tRNA uridine-5-carboxymethylaminomethyl(34) synthesis GTPase MnmE [Prevotella sp.]MCM1075271.1 tRNA uridine-5-carboxymethylaminomethyl(34) synthesis GTPase MnmE [Ruminococcus sp.]